MTDEKKPPVRLYEQRMRYTPDGTQFSNELTREGREKLRSLEQAKAQAEMKSPNEETVREKFKERATMLPKTTTKTKFKRAAKKDRDDFER